MTSDNRLRGCIVNILRRKNLIALGLTAILGTLAGESARADHLLPRHALDCSENFPCPAALQPRVRFWVEVFSNWDSKTAILHDPNRPERVYAVFKSSRGCNRGARLTSKRKQIGKSLRAVAAKIESGGEISGRNHRHLARLFPAGNAGEIRAAAKNIRCQRGVRDGFISGLKRYNHHRPMVDNVLSENALPAEIRYLPFVESSYNPAAYSRVGAAGLWQIMPKTARVLGLELNATLDERLDPEAATRAAAKYLKNADRDLTEVARETNPAITRAQINPFIITSYNYGVYGMKRAIREVEPDFMAVLARHKSPSFQIAVKNFYASFLAARHVAVNAETYFGALALENEGDGEYQTVVLQHPTSMARIQSVFGLSEARLRPLNRALTRYVWRGWRLIPAGYRLRLPARSHGWQAGRVKLASLGPEQVISGGDHYTVRRGDTACGIARAIKVNCSVLIRANRLGKKAVIHVGQKLLIPGKLVVATTTTADPSAPGQTRTSGDFAGTYRVQKGDTACGIAKRFAVGCRTLIRENRLGRTAKIYPGQELSIPGGTLASLQPGSLNSDNQYIVRKNDSACRVARLLKVDCKALLALNQLGNAALIYPGQKLKIPGLVVPETSETAQQLAQGDGTIAGEVEAAGGDAAKPPTPAAGGDTAKPPTPATGGDAELAAQIAKFADALAAVEADADEAARATWAPLLNADANTLRNLLDTLPDFGIRVSGDDSGKPVYSVRVEADETLGHFADWLGIGSAGALRRLNNLRGNQPIHIGRRLLLPVADAQMAERFEQQRTDYHQVLSESLKEHYDLVGIESYSVKPGDSPWLLSNRLGFPVWLLYRLNPVLRDAPLRPGQLVTLPKLREKV